MRENWPDCMGSGSWPHSVGTGELAQNLNWGEQFWWELGLSHSAPTQAQSQCSDLTLPTIWPTHDQLEHMKGLALRNYGSRISRTQGNGRISQRSLSEGPVPMLYQKPEALNLTNDSLPWTFISTTVWAKEYNARHTTSPKVTKKNEGDREEWRW